MKLLNASLAVAVLLGTPALAGDMAENTGMKPSAKPEAITIDPTDVKWGDAPPDLPKGARFAALHGDPTKKEVFTVRLRMARGYKIPPHWHSNDEQLTVIAGTLVLHMGDTMDAPAHDLVAGSYHYLPAKMHHAAEVKADTIVQIDGMGPFDIHYLNPADNPNKTAAK